MTLFWIGAGLIAAASLGLLVRPLLFKPARAEEAPELDESVARAARIAVHKEQVAALEAQVEQGLLNPSEAPEVRAELERDLARQEASSGQTPARTEDEKIQAAAQRPANLLLAVVLCIGLPVSGFALYIGNGAPAALDPQARVAPAIPENPGPEDIARMVSGLEQRLAQSPDDGEGWLMLGRSYFVLERFEESASAYRKAEGLLDENPQMLVDSAEAHAFAANNQLSGAPRERIERALAIAPDFPKALWLGGFAALQAGEAETALSYWTRLSEQLPDGSQEKATLTTLMEGIAPATTPSAGAAGASDAASAQSGAGSTLAGGDETGQPNGDGPRLKVTVELAPALQGQHGTDAVLFVFARNPQGPPMPVAAVRRLASELPLTLYMDDSNAMLPNARLSGSPTVLLTARISNSGSPTPSAGDLQGSLGPLTPADHDVSAEDGATGETRALRIVISERVE